MAICKIQERIKERNPALKKEDNCLICNPRNPNFLEEYLTHSEQSNNFQRLLTFMRRHWKDADAFNALAKHFEDTIPTDLKTSCTTSLENCETHMLDIAVDYFTMETTQIENIRDIIELDTLTKNSINLLRTNTNSRLLNKSLKVKEDIRYVHKLLQEEASIFFKPFYAYLTLAKGPKRTKLGIEMDKWNARRETRMYGEYKWSLEIAEAHANGVYYLIDKFGYPEWDEGQANTFERNINTLTHKRIQTTLTNISTSTEKIIENFSKEIGIRFDIFKHSILSKYKEIEKHVFRRIEHV